MNLPSQGAAGDDLRRQAHQEWLEAAARAGLTLEGLDPDAPFEQRAAWAIQAGLVIACVYARFSSKHQHSTADQVRANVLYAASHRMYVPPELICIDEAEKGRRVHRNGLERLKHILQSKLASVMLVFKASRLFRRAYLGYQLIQEEVVEEGLRAVSVSQGIDSTSKSWKAQIQMYGVMDDLLLDTIADFVREGHIGLFKKGFTTGALGIGFRRVEVPEARPTNRGLPRTKPDVDPEVAALIRQHADWLLQGMPVVEGVRRWRAAGGPVDPRCTTGVMSRDSYVRLFTNARLIGRWEYGRKRNVWSSKRDYTRQVAQPEGEIITIQCQLRILPDEVFYELQKLFAGRKIGPRGPRKNKAAELHHLVTEVFRCPHCGRRFYTAGAHGQAMRCANLTCPSPVMVNRREAVQGLCEKLTELIQTDTDLIVQAVATTHALDEADDDIARHLTELERKERALTNRIQDLTELAGEGSDGDRMEFKAKIKAALAERAGVRADLTRCRQQVGGREPVTPEQVRVVLGEFGQLLQDGASGTLGPDAVYRVADVFRRLVGGQVEVHVEPRAGRKRGLVRGRFVPYLLQTVSADVGLGALATPSASAAVEVWLRHGPRLDAIASEVRRLYEEEGLGFRTIAKRLGIGCGNIYQSYQRYYEMQNLPVPPRRPRGRHKRAG